MIFSRLHHGVGEFWYWAALLTVASFFTRFFAFLQTPFANGWDCYFYLIQLRAWLETGSMHSPEASLIYPFFAVIYCFTTDYVLAFKIGAALLAAFFTFSILIFFQKKSERLAVVAGILTLWSTHLTWFSAQFPKNLMGVAVLVLFLRWLDVKFSIQRLAIGVGLLAIQFFIHRMTFGLAAMAISVWVFVYSFQNYRKFKPSRWQFKWSWKWVGLAFLLIFVIFGMFFAQFPGLLHWSDAERWNNEGMARWYFSPQLFIKNFGADGRMSIFWKLEVAAAVLAGWCFFLFQKNKTPQNWALAVLGGLLILPIDEWSFSGMSFRFCAVFVLFLPLFLSFLIKKDTFVFFHKRLDSSSFSFFGKKITPSIWQKMIGGSLILITMAMPSGYQPAVHDPPYPLFSKITDGCRKIFDNSEKPELVIAHAALAEFFTFETGIDAMPWQPEYAIDSSKLWRIVAEFRHSELQYFLRDDTLAHHFRLPGGYFLMTEGRWQKIIRQATDENDLDFLERVKSWRNPSRQRPVFLLRRKNK